MKSWKASVAVGVVGLMAPLAAAQTGPQDNKTTAQTLVGQCANIKTGDRVLVAGSPHNQALLEEIALACRKVGAFPLVAAVSEQYERRSYDEVPAKFDTQTDEFDLRLTDIITARISVDAMETDGLMTGVSAQRIADRGTAARPIMDASLKSKIKSVSLGNGLFPTAATAKRQGVTLDQLTTIFWSGVNADYSKLQQTGEQVKARLAKGGEAHLTNPNGTDLKFTITNPNIFVSDGVISAEDLAKGGPACSVWLPAGEVYTAPAVGTAEGKVVIDRDFFQGKEIIGLTLTFKGGKLTDMTAKSGIEPLKALYDAAGPGKDNFAVVDVGINQSMSIPKGTTLLAWMPAGMVTIGLGDNTWAGGTVKSNFDFSGFVPGSTLTIDGKVLVEKGELKP